ncbi:Transforming protein v-Fos/v-Fox [Aphelenchoides bicaudatus]|nr:Transforming protein v-Fos/v-Fox [Aphelenchoides bicaudatus]
MTLKLITLSRGLRFDCHVLVKIHGNDLNSPLVDYHAHQFPGAANSSGHLHNRLPPLQPGFAVPTEFPLTGLMTRSGNSSVYGTRSQASGRKGGRRPREIEDKDQYALSQEDKEKRQKRRERNKQAAARCRKRRMDLMETLQKQVDDLRTENENKQRIIDQLNEQSRNLMGVLSSHSCQHHSKILPQQVRHLQQQQTNKDQSLIYNGCDMMSQQQNQLHLKMEPDSDQRLPSDMDSLFKDDQMMSDRSSPINDSYPITTCSMITNNDPVISHATFQPTSIKRSKLNESPLISESNESPAFSRPTSLPLAAPRYSNELGNNLPSLNTPSAGLNIYSGSEFSLLNQQTFLTPMTLGPIPVTSNANTPPHGDLRQL